MSQFDVCFVKRGYWTNLEQGPIMGKTLTTDLKTGIIIIAFLAILSSLAMSHLWNIVLFVLHRIRANGAPADGFFRQQQVLLRSLPTPDSMLADIVKLWWVWRRYTDRPLWRSLLHMGLSTTFIGATITVSILSSQVVSSTDLQVLIQSPFCGPINLNSSDQNVYTSFTKLELHSAKISAAALRFAKECYRNDTDIPGSCRTFTRPNIPFVRRQVACPFARSIWASDFKEEVMGIQFDSGLVDLNEGFGLNLKDRDRVKFRKRTTYSVLQTKAYATIINATKEPGSSRPPFPGDEMLVLNYGGPRNLTTGVVSTNKTYYHSLLKSNFTDYYTLTCFASYKSPGWNTIGAIELIPALNIKDADLLLIIKSDNVVKYGTTINDPFFPAHQVWGEDRDTVGNEQTLYIADVPASAMGCVLEYQFCYTRPDASNFCTNLTALPANVLADEYPGASDIQLAVIQLLITSSILFDTWTAVAQNMDAAALLANTGYIPTLPDNQWTHEATNWESFVWAALQMNILEYAIGPAVREPSTAALMKNKTSKGERKLCNTQKMRVPSGFVNINLFGLVFIITLAILVFLLDNALLRQFIATKNLKRTVAPRIDHWIQDGLFQLQRRAYEACGEGKWDNLDWEVPVTIGKHMFVELPLTLYSSSRLSDSTEI